jgi:hypothetical protein
MTIEHTFQVGRYRCIARYDGPVPVPGPVLRTEYEWSPHPPDWDRASPPRNALLMRVPAVPSAHGY